MFPSSGFSDITSWQEIGHSGSVNGAETGECYESPPPPRSHPEPAGRVCQRPAGPAGCVKSARSFSPLTWLLSPHPAPHVTYTPIHKNPVSLPS